MGLDTPDRESVCVCVCVWYVHACVWCVHVLYVCVGEGGREEGGGGKSISTSSPFKHSLMRTKTWRLRESSFHHLATADLRTSTVADFISLPDPITTDWVSYSHGGLIGETAAKVEGRQSFLEIRSATVAPLGGRRTPGDGSHDAVT